MNVSVCGVVWVFVVCVVCVGRMSLEREKEHVR